MKEQDILALLPYERPFLFVDEIEELRDDHIKGNYTFRQDEFFYAGHFKNNPVTPGVILTETMAQIGLVALGIYIWANDEKHVKLPNIAMTASQVNYYLPVYPGDKVSVISEKEYFRFNILKCKVKMFNANQELICRGTISGMIISSND